MDFSAAREYLERAAAADPSLGIAHLNLARLYARTEKPDLALQAVDHALAIDPMAWVAHFEKAKLLEAAGRQRAADAAWATGLQYIADDLRDLPQLQADVLRARDRVTAGQAALAGFLHDRLRTLRAGQSGRDLERMQHSLDIVTGRREFVTARPLMLPIPRLPAIPFFDREDFPWAATVEAAYPAILGELSPLLQDRQGFEPYVQTAVGEPKGQFADLDRKPDWSAYFLWKNGCRIAANADRCPATEAAIAGAPQIAIKDRAPVIFFSVLQPGTHIPPHHGATNARLTVHLPLVVPPNCALRVGDETRGWKVGELVLFDDTIRHEAWNRSAQIRVVLIFDVWHPMLTELEREIVQETVQGMMEFYGSDVDMGEL